MLLPVFALFRALAADVECTVVNVVVKERRDGAGEENVESALWVVPPPNPVAAVLPDCPVVDFAAP